jgi:hypothetical protein
MRTFIYFIFFLACSQSTFSQYAIDLIPRVSSDNSISERVAYTEISINYGSPKVRGRAIWGEMEEYGQIWRAGANKATKISFSEDVKIDGEKLAAGVYSFFVIPKEEGPWTVIFNKIADQWGAFSYEEAEDALRIEIQPQTNTHVEDLTFDIIAKEFEGASVTLEWEKVKLSFFVEVEHLLILEKTLAEKLAILPKNTHWVVYLQAATYLIDHNQRLEKADEWLGESDALYQKDGEWSGQFYPKDYILGDLLWAKAKLAALNNQFDQALKYATLMKDIAGDYTFYGRENEAEQIDFRMDKWKDNMN